MYKFAHFPRIGIIGGGQLAKMTALAAMKYGCSVVILEKLKRKEKIITFNLPDGLIDLYLE